MIGGGWENVSIFTALWRNVSLSGGELFQEKVEVNETALKYRFV